MLSGVTGCAQRLKLMEEAVRWTPRNPNAGSQDFIKSMEEQQHLCCWIHRGQMRGYAGSFWADFHDPVTLSHILTDITFPFPFSPML